MSNLDKVKSMRISKLINSIRCFIGLHKYRGYLADNTLYGLRRDCLHCDKKQWGFNNGYGNKWVDIN